MSELISVMSHCHVFILDPPAVPGPMQAAVVTADLGAAAADRACAAGAAAGRLVRGQVSGGGVGGRALSGRAPGLPHNGRVGVPQQQLCEVGLLQNLPALVYHGAAGQRGGGAGGWGEGQGGEGEAQGGGQGQGEGGSVRGEVDRGGVRGGVVGRRG